MNLNDLLQKQGIEASKVLVLRHRPIEPSLREVIRWLAAERPKVFNAYQQTQTPQVEAAMQRSDFLVSLIGHEPGQALFVGLYERANWHGLSKDDYWSIPVHQELQNYGMRGFVDERSSILKFELVEASFYSDWKGRLVFSWPGGERSWWRWADRNELLVHTIHPESILVPTMPPWSAITVTYAQLSALPHSWRAALEQWRGIYFLIDKSDGKGYVGSAYGTDNLLGRWTAYAATGHGGNIELLDRNRENFVFSILQLVSQDLDAKDVQGIESVWKDRLHTRTFGLNRN